MEVESQVSYCDQLSSHQQQGASNQKDRKAQKFKVRNNLRSPQVQKQLSSQSSFHNYNSNFKRLSCQSENQQISVKSLYQEQFNQRMIIDQIEIQNFKSFKSDQQNQSWKIRNLDNNFNAVIGPNGNGKSNVLEAIVFVMGFQGSKLRIKNGLSLLHKNAQTGQVEKFCQVTVHFIDVLNFYQQDGKIGVQRLEDTRFSITRRMDLVGQGKTKSNYFINGISKRKQEIEDKLRQKQLDLTHCRFMIMQNEVSKITTMKEKQTINEKGEKIGSEGYLEYLEEIIGTTEFHEEILKLETQLEIHSKVVATTFKSLAKARDEFNVLDQEMNEIRVLVKNEFNYIKMKRLIQLIEQEKKQSRYQECKGKLQEKQKQCEDKQDEFNKICDRYDSFIQDYNTYQGK